MVISPKPLAMEMLDQKVWNLQVKSQTIYCPKLDFYLELEPSQLVLGSSRARASLGGSASYSSWSFKKNVEALDTYAHAHTLPDGTFASPLEEENFNLLKEEFERQRTQNNPFLEDEGELGESSAPAISNVQVFEKVLGVRRGIYRGLGRKPSLSSASSDVSPHEKEKTRPQFSEEYFDELFEDPRFMERLYQAMDKKRSRKDNENDTDEEGE
ncbi:hypothetical protein HanLR1_Chr12g0436501 [Helianthus annuus]|nr:hypothetical protein HanLR1_Chr12g0436501 [Helianthus annuus]